MRPLRVAAVAQVRKSTCDQPFCCVMAAWVREDHDSGRNDYEQHGWRLVPSVCWQAACLMLLVHATAGASGSPHGGGCMLGGTAHREAVRVHMWVQPVGWVWRLDSELALEPNK